MADDPALPLQGLDDPRPDPLPEVRRLLLFFPGASAKPPRAKEVERGRWEWECVVMGYPAARAVGATRRDCLHDAIRAMRAALALHAKDLRERAQRATEQADEIERALAEVPHG